MRGLMVGVLAVGLAGWAIAQDEPRRGYSTILDNADVLIDNYARFLARKYDLTEEQSTFTQKLLHDRAQQFLERHKPELSGLVDRMFEVRTGGEMDPSELLNWGRQVMPIYNEAKKIILEANDEWRSVLTDQQRQIHDEDLKLMHESFATTEDQLNRIVTGQMSVDEFRSPSRTTQMTGTSPNTGRRSQINRRAQRAERTPAGAESADTPQVREDGPRRPSRPVLPAGEGGGGGSAAAGIVPPQPETPAMDDDESSDSRQPAEDAGGKPRRGADAGGGKSLANPKSESEWESYVRQFCDRYQLDDAQRQRAQSILKDCQEQADRHKTAHRDEIEKIDQQTAALSKSSEKYKSQQIADLGKQRTKLMEPVNAIFEKQLKPRLDALPTRAQRKAAESSAGKPGKDKAPRGAEKTGDSKSKSAASGRKPATSRTTGKDGVKTGDRPGSSDQPSPQPEPPPQLEPAPQPQPTPQPQEPAPAGEP
jgi:hypothetical protein